MDSIWFVSQNAVFVYDRLYRQMVCINSERIEKTIPENLNVTREKSLRERDDYHE